MEFWFDKLYKSPPRKKHVNYTPHQKKGKKNEKNNKNTHPQKTVIFEKNYF